MDKMRCFGVGDAPCIKSTMLSTAGDFIRRYDRGVIMRQMAEDILSVG